MRLSWCEAYPPISMLSPSIVIRSDWHCPSDVTVAYFPEFRPGMMATRSPTENGPPFLRVCLPVMSENRKNAAKGALVRASSPVAGIANTKSKTNSGERNAASEKSTVASRNQIANASDASSQMRIQMGLAINRSRSENIACRRENPRFGDGRIHGVPSIVFKPQSRQANRTCVQSIDSGCFGFPAVSRTRTQRRGTRTPTRMNPPQPIDLVHGVPGVDWFCEVDWPPELPCNTWFVVGLRIVRPEVCCSFCSRATRPAKVPPASASNFSRIRCSSSRIGWLVMLGAT